MKKYIGAVSGFALLASVGMAAADEATGTLMEVDEATQTITLDDGTTYVLADGVSIEGFAPGQEVTVSFEEEDGENVAHSIEPAMQ